MSILFLVILVLVALFLLNSTKHHLGFRLKRIVLILIIFFVVLAIFSSYFDMSLVLGKNNLFAKTGAAIFGGVKDKISVDPLIREGELDFLKKEIVKGSDELVKKVDSWSVSYSKAENNK